jgi:archaellum component FlaC|tara:strand:+ start:608 stop:766 length:159 start_codon:yes stop_codon:yes gene_type:complete
MGIKQRIKGLFGGNKEIITTEDRVKLLEDKVKDLEHRVDVLSRPAPSGRRLG